MSTLPQVSGEKLVKALRRDGWITISQKGSHQKLVKHHKPEGHSTVIVPMHKTLKKGTLGAILKDAKMPLEKLRKLL